MPLFYPGLYPHNPHFGCNNGPCRNNTFCRVIGLISLCRLLSRYKGTESLTHDKALYRRLADLWLLTRSIAQITLYYVVHPFSPLVLSRCTPPRGHFAVDRRGDIYTTPPHNSLFFQPPPNSLFFPPIFQPTPIFHYSFKCSTKTFQINHMHSISSCEHRTCSLGTSLASRGAGMREWWLSWFGVVVDHLFGFMRHNRFPGSPMSHNSGHSLDKVRFLHRADTPVWGLLGCSKSQRVSEIIKIACSLP